MRHVKKLLLLGAAFALLAQVNGYGYDSEWPPKPDPYYSNVNPAQGLAMGTISIDIPSTYSQWFQHSHNVGWGAVPFMFSIGDVEGADDGDVDMVIHQAEELLLAGRLSINWVSHTGTFTPLWGWKSPVCPATPPGNNDFHSGKRPVAVWDFDGDGTNEVAIVAPDDGYTSGTGGNFKRAIYLFQTDPNSTDYVSGWNVPKPKLLAKSAPENYTNPQTCLMGEGLGICKVRNTAYPQDLAALEYTGTAWSVWSPQKNAGTWTIPMSYKHTYQNGKLNHLFNWLDVDGDGYDEFMFDGVYDFVDAGGPTNGQYGVIKWATGMNSNRPNDHSDMTICADFNVNHAGLEVMAAPGVDWYDTLGAHHLNGYAVLFDINGNILDEATGPYHHPQNIQVGNFVPDNITAGLETIHVAKSYGAIAGDESNTVNPSNPEIYQAASYAEDQDLNNIVVDGAYWVSQPVWVGGNPYYPTRATGPGAGLDPLWPMDWDGDHASDEICNAGWACDFVWRMGKKGSWYGGSAPAGMPNQTQVLSGWQESVGGTTVTLCWEYYQMYNGSKAGTWGWNNGGAGRWTHYYEKLGEIHSTGLHHTVPFDVGGDYREELVRLKGGSPAQVVVNYNSASLADPDAYFSPTISLDYLAARQNSSLTFDFRTIPSPTSPTASFIAAPTTGLSPLTVSFTDTSANLPTSWAWDFTNDGTVDATTQNASHTYSPAGVYTAKLTASNAYGSSTATALIKACASVTYYSIGADDGYLQESSESSGVGGAANSNNTGTGALRVGDTQQKYQYRTMLSFDTSSLPDTADILVGTLKMKRGTCTTENPFDWASVTCRVDLKTPYFGAQALEASDFESTPTRNNVATMSKPANNGDWSTGALNSVGMANISKTATTQFKIYLTQDDDNDGTADYCGFYPGDNGTANGPALELQYTP